MDKINIIKDRIDFLIKTNSTDKEIFNLFKDLFILVPYDIDYLMLYSRFLWRTCYWRWKDKKFLKESEIVLYKVLKIHNIINIDNKSLTFWLYQVYAWLGMIYWYYWDTKKAFLFFKEAEKYILYEKEKKQLAEWKSWIYIHMNDYNKVFSCLLKYNISTLRFRSILYLAISYYETWDFKNFHKYIKFFLKENLNDKKYFFIENKSSIYVLSLVEIDLPKEEILLRVKNLNKDLNVEYLLYDKLDNILIGIEKLLNLWWKIYWLELGDKYLKIYLKELKPIIRFYEKIYRSSCTYQ